ncbi:hypothetical protein [Larsenimonas suaedae]|uniref:Uncharacterized protein n=1 Tax=Larsenimonas suaedae TaxID=1851019 RepID=A0ABU1GZ50_9GAMM|nr:hypothetical protein [Larsenimonas suaedae]MCM2973792.1 hypothetical protein [Larsenimonas suaedae]MDR5897316.1 hypothetical protein [Larsenimonas suaedae]
MDALIIADMDGAQAQYILEVDQLAERHRLLFVTDGSGQALAYQEKYAEAVEYNAGHDGPFPHLNAEAEARELSVEALVSEVVAMRTAWRSVSAQIEAARARAKKRIRSTQDTEDWTLAVQAFKTELPALKKDAP